MPCKKSILLILFFCTSNVYLFAQTCPPNLDLEYGNFQNWKFDTGSCCPIFLTSVPSALPGRHELMSGPGTDKYGFFPVVAPGGSYSLKLGGESIYAKAEAARYSIHVPSNVNSYIVIFNYAVVFQDPAHIPFDQPRFQVTAIDSATGQPISCGSLSFVASSVLPGFKKSPIPPPAGIPGIVYYKEWTYSSLNLTKHKGKTMIMEFANGDCGLGGHFGYTYVDIDCNQFQSQIINCSNSSTITLSAPPGFQNYVWMDALFNTTYATTRVATVAAPPVSVKKFACIVTPYPGFGCVDTFFCDVLSQHVLTTTPDTIICTDNDSNVHGSIQLNVSSNSNAFPYTYNWWPSQGLNCINCPNPKAKVKSSTVYHVTITDANGCISEDSFRVDLQPHFSSIINLKVDTTCQYEQIEIQNAGTISNKIHNNWLLDTGGVIIKQDSNGIKATWLSPGLKKIKIKGSDGICEKTDSAFVFVKPGPLAAFETNYNICKGASVNIYPRKEQDAIYRWLIEEAEITDTAYREYHTLHWDSTGTKQIQLTVASPNGCTNTFDTAINVHAYPSGRIQIKNNSYCIGDTIELGTQAGDYYTYQWAPAGIFLNSNTSNVRAVVSVQVPISLVVTSEWGCTSSDTAFLQLNKCCKIKFPDAFSPNNDGRNDLFHAMFSTDSYELYNLLIFNRWGNILFETSDDQSGWDGTYNNTPQDAGTYYYYIKYICDGQILEKKGSIILIR